LSLERLDVLANKEPLRIGLSATQKPIELVANFLAGSSRPDSVVVQIGHQREVDIAIEVPKSELGPVTSHELWDEVYERIAALVRQHRSTLIFVNTRRLAERVRKPWQRITAVFRASCDSLQKTNLKKAK
jgi:ATP-dependent helicase Lhr and Lhr-like helicase